MAVVQISRIQHRSGTSDNLPQLARGEIGLAVDTRRVYIGNGGSDAPTTENLEILTNRSNILEVSETYTYKDSQIGFSAQTGVSASSPILRTLQNKLDDIANVRDFGAVGDGETDDTAAINRALYEIFAREQIIRVRRMLYFPAGKYLVTGLLKIPSFAYLKGEGPDSTIIYGNDVTENAVAQFADSKQQVDASVGSGTGLPPQFIVIDGMTLESGVDIPVLHVDQAESCYINNSKIIGPSNSAPSSVGNANPAVKITSTASYTTKHINFKNCTIGNHVFGVNIDHDMNSVHFDSCRFEHCFKGLKIGENVTGLAPAINGPKSVKITGSLFDDIYNRGIQVYNGDNVSSAYNLFKDVANDSLGAGNASTHVIDFAAGVNSNSFGDSFDRGDGDVTTSTKRIQLTNANAAYGTTLEIGAYSRTYNNSVSLSNNVSATATGVQFDEDSGTEYAVEIDYLISRNSKYRQGKLRIVQDGTAQVLDDDFTENNGDVGVTFDLQSDSGFTKLRYATDNQTTGTLYLSVRKLST